MTSKEIKEIRRLYAKERCSVSRLCGCYVNGEKQIVSTFSGGLLGMDDEDFYKYIEILKKCLSGTFEKNLFNIDIPLAFEKDDDAYKLLLSVRDSKLYNEELLELYYTRIIETYEHVGNYLILVAADTYDVPGKSELGDTIDDASEESFTYFITAICPVELAKPGLAYNEAQGRFLAIDRDWVAGKPETAFMFPAFNDRSTDIHASLLYVKKGDALQEDFIRGMFGTDKPTTAEEKKGAFGSLVSKVYGEEFDADKMKAVHETLAEEAEMIKADPQADPTLSRTHVKAILERSGAEDEQLEKFDQYYEHAFGEDGSVNIDNLLNKRSFTVKNENVEIKIDASRTDLVRFEKINGVMCAVIELSGDTEVNGVPV